MDDAFPGSPPSQSTADLLGIAASICEVPYAALYLDGKPPVMSGPGAPIDLREVDSAPLIDRSSRPRGRVAVLDAIPHALSRHQRESLRSIAAQIVHSIEIDEQRRLVAEPSQREPTEPGAAPLASRKLRVLIVEDDEAVAMGLRWSLEEEGVTVQVAATGGEALPALSAFLPDVVVLDLSLPDDDGRSVYQRIAPVFAGPVIFSSGYALEHEIQAFIRNPRTAFLMKPYSGSDLLQLIDEMLDIDRRPDE